MEGVDLRATVGVEVAVGVVAGGCVGLSVASCPGVGAALGDGDGLVHRVEDGQMEGVDLRATVGIGVAEGVGAGGGVGLSVPDEGTAGLRRDGCVHRIVDGQVEGVDLGAAVGVGVTVGVVAGSRVGLSVPSVRAALTDGDCRVDRVVDGQVEGVDLCAAVGIGVAVGVGAGGGVGRAVAVRPGVGAAFHDGVGLVHRGVDGHHHRHDAVAAVGGFQGDGLRAGGVEGLAVPDDRQLINTNRPVHRDFEGLVHGEDHGHNGVATSGRVQRGELRAWAGEDDTVPEIGQSCRADRALFGDEVGWVDGQREGDDAVAAVDGLQRVGVDAARGEGLAKEVVTVALADGGRDGHIVGRVDMQGHGHRGVAAIGGLQCGGLRAGLGEGLAVPGERQLARANGARVGHRVGRVDGQREGDDAVAAIDGLQRVGVGAARGEGLAEEAVAFALADGGRDGHIVGREDVQGHGDRGVAAVDGLQGGGLCASLSEGLAVPGERQLARANGALVGHRVGRVDGQREGDDAVAAVDGLQRMGVSAARGEGLAEEAVAVALADGGRDGRVVGLVQRQGHGHDGVASVDGLQGHGLCAGTVEGESVPSVGQLARADGTRVGHRVGRVDGQVEGDHTVAAVGGGERLGVVARGGVAFAVPHVGQLVLANALVILCGVALFGGDSEDAGGELIAGGGGHDDGVITRSDGDGLRGFAGAPEVGDFHVGGGGQLGGVARANAAVTGNVSNGGNDAGGGGEGHDIAPRAQSVGAAVFLRLQLVETVGMQTCQRVGGGRARHVRPRTAVLAVAQIVGAAGGPGHVGGVVRDVGNGHVVRSGAGQRSDHQCGAEGGGVASRGADVLHLHAVRVAGQQSVDGVRGHFVGHLVPEVRLAGRSSVAHVVGESGGPGDGDGVGGDGEEFQVGGHAARLGGEAHDIAPGAEAVGAAVALRLHLIRCAGLQSGEAEGGGDALGGGIHPFAAGGAVAQAVGVAGSPGERGAHGTRGDQGQVVGCGASFGGEGHRGAQRAGDVKVAAGIDGHGVFGLGGEAEQGVGVAD